MARQRTARPAGRPAGDSIAPVVPWGAAKRLSDRTPLRTKLITALLALVIMALAAISVASVSCCAPT